MPRVVLVGVQQPWVSLQRREVVEAAFEKELPGLDCQVCLEIDEAARVLIENPVPSIVYVFLGEATERTALKPLLPTASRDRCIPVIVEIEFDEPTRALELMRDGVFSVTVPITNLEKLANLFGDALGGATHQSWPPLAKRLRPNDEEGFMSMNWGFNHRDRVDFRAVRGVMWQLGLTLQRLDEFLQEESNILRRIQEAIALRRVVVAMISPHDTNQSKSVPSPNVMFEIGVAYTLGKRVLLLYRDTGREPFEKNKVIPAVLKGEVFVEYSSYTDLALKLFFGFGGQAEDIKDWPGFK